MISECILFTNVKWISLDWLKSGHEYQKGGNGVMPIELRVDAERLWRKELNEAILL